MSERAPSAAKVEAALGALLPAGVEVVVWGSRPTDPDEPELAPVEREAIARAVRSRRLEFARGRFCAREALARLGARSSVGGRGGDLAGGGAGDPSGVAIPVGLERAPVWPAGFTGSITHCEGLVAAVAARTSAFEAIGIDAEPARPLPSEVREAVLTPAERRFLEEADLLDTVVFAAKEAVHKAVHPLTGVWLDFLDVTLELDPVGGLFGARAAGAVGSAAGTPAWAGTLVRLRGRFGVVEGYVVAVVTSG